MYLCQVESQILDILGELHIVYIDRGGGGGTFVCTCWILMVILGSISFYSPCLYQFWIAARLIYSFFEAMIASMSVASTAV
jgi:hypothetical protein